MCSTSLLPAGEGAGGEGDVYLPLYEAKMIWQFDHRFSSYEGVESRSSTHLPETTEAQHADPCYQVLPWYWVAEEEVEGQLQDWDRAWLLGFRKTTNATNERTVVAVVQPRVAVGDKEPLLFLNQPNAAVSALLLSGCLNSLACDYVARQKLGGTDISHFCMKQFTVLAPRAFGEQTRKLIVPRALELAYTAWDLKPFADDVMAEADEALCDAILAQFADNRRATGGHDWSTAPSWVGRSTGFPPSSGTPIAGRCCAPSWMPTMPASTA